MKYMGSKSRIAKYIVPIIQSYIDNNNIKKYFEPFLGGANVIDKIKCNQKYGSDKNKYLIALIRYVQSGGELYEDVPKELYDKARNAYNNGTDEFEDWEIGNIGFLASYNGRWFDGGYAKPGYEKTKNGLRYRDYYQEAKRNLLKQAVDLQGIKFNCCDYFDYDLFWDTMRKWSRNNIVLISEENAPSDFECIWEQEVSRSIKANDKSKSTEKLFMYNTKL